MHTAAFSPAQAQAFAHLLAIVQATYPQLTDRQVTAMAAWMLEVYKAPPATVPTLSRP
jgi:hypothetical protein